jgi:hypothetical protein
MEDVMGNTVIVLRKQRKSLLLGDLSDRRGGQNGILTPIERVLGKLIST